MLSKVSLESCDGLLEVSRAAESAEQREQCCRTNSFSSDKVSEKLPDVLSNDYDKLDKLSNHYDILEKLSNYYDILEKKNSDD